MWPFSHIYTKFTENILSILMRSIIIKRIRHIFPRGGHNDLRLKLRVALQIF